MSYGAELAEEMMIDREIARQEMQENIKCGIWVTRRGDAVRIRDMTTSHIRNCIKMLDAEGISDEGYSYLCMFRKELERRPKRKIHTEFVYVK